MKAAQTGGGQTGIPQGAPVGPGSPLGSSPLSAQSPMQPYTIAAPLSPPPQTQSPARLGAPINAAPPVPPHSTSGALNGHIGPSPAGPPVSMAPCGPPHSLASSPHPPASTGPPTRGSQDQHTGPPSHELTHHGVYNLPPSSGNLEQFNLGSTPSPGLPTSQWDLKPPISNPYMYPWYNAPENHQNILT